jgi:hypothetical protein
MPKDWNAKSRAIRNIVSFIHENAVGLRGSRAFFFLGDALSGVEKNIKKRRKDREVFIHNFFYSRSCEVGGKAVVSLR